MKKTSNSTILRYAFYAAIMLSLCNLLINTSLTAWQCAGMIAGCGLLILYLEYRPKSFWPFSRPFSYQLTNYHLLGQLLLLVVMLTISYIVIGSPLEVGFKAFAIIALSIGYIAATRFVDNLISDRLEIRRLRSGLDRISDDPSIISRDYQFVYNTAKDRQRAYFEQLCEAARNGNEYAKLYVAHSYRDGCGVQKHTLIAINHYVDIIRSTQNKALKASALSAYWDAKYAYEHDLLNQAKNDPDNTLDCFYRLGLLYRRHVLYPEEESSTSMAEAYFRKAANWGEDEEKTQPGCPPHVDAVNELMWLDFYKVRSNYNDAVSHQAHQLEKHTTSMPSPSNHDDDVNLSETYSRLQKQSEWVLKHPSTSDRPEVTPSKTRDEALLLYCWSAQKLSTTISPKSIGRDSDSKAYCEMLAREEELKNPYVDEMRLVAKLTMPFTQGNRQSFESGLTSRELMDTDQSVDEDDLLNTSGCLFSPFASRVDNYIDSRILNHAIPTTPTTPHFMTDRLFSDKTPGTPLFGIQENDNSDLTPGLFSDDSVDHNDDDHSSRADGPGSPA